MKEFWDKISNSVTSGLISEKPNNLQVSSVIDCSDENNGTTKLRQVPNGVTMFRNLKIII